MPIVETKYPLAQKDPLSERERVFLFVFFTHADDLPLIILMVYEIE